MTKKLIMFVGLPGSGKSSFRSLMNLDYEKTFVYSTDDYIERYALLNNKTYNECFVDLIKTAEQFMNDKVRGIKTGEINPSIVLWDQTNLTVKSRAKKLQLFDDTWEKYAVFFDKPMDKILATNEHRLSYGREIPNNIIRSMHQTMEEPTTHEGFKFVWRVTNEA